MTTYIMNTYVPLISKVLCQGQEVGCNTSVRLRWTTGDHVLPLAPVINIIRTILYDINSLFDEWVRQASDASLVSHL